MYLNALNRFIHTCSTQKVDVSRYFLKKPTFLVRFPNFIQKSVFFKKISRYINFLFRTNVDKSIQGIQIHRLPYKKKINLLKKKSEFFNKIKKIIPFSRRKDINLQLKYFKGFLLDPFRNFCSRVWHDLRKRSKSIQSFKKGEKNVIF